MISAPITPAPLSQFARDTVKRLLRVMARTADDTTLKQCIMTAREHGHLDDDETAMLINAWGVRNS